MRTHVFSWFSKSPCISYFPIWYFEKGLLHFDLWKLPYCFLFSVSYIPTWVSFSHMHTGWACWGPLPDDALTPPPSDQVWMHLLQVPVIETRSRSSWWLGWGGRPSSEYMPTELPAWFWQMGTESETFWRIKMCWRKIQKMYLLFACPQGLSALGIGKPGICLQLLTCVICSRMSWKWD